MKIVIFAGGVGTRLWPLSRKNSPKQFERLIGNKSTLQKTVDRLFPAFKPEDIYIATGQHYEKVVREQLPQIPAGNFIFEPEMRDVGPAVGLVATILNKRFPHEPVAILWSDHLVKNVNTFLSVLLMAENKIKEDHAKLIFIGQKPRFANQNTGWIEVGDLIENSQEQSEIQIYNFKQLRYRPSLSEAERFFSKKNFIWNLGYFVTTPHYLLQLFQKHVPDMYKKLVVIQDSLDSNEYKKTLGKIYPQLEKISFDDAILTKLKEDGTLVIFADLGWSDIGAWEALKEALSHTTDENITDGQVLLKDSKDSLVFNNCEALIVGIDLQEMLVINTTDVVLICPKNSVPKIKKLVESLSGTEYEHLT